MIKLGIIGAWGHFTDVLEEMDHHTDFEVTGLACGMPDDDFSPFRIRYASLKKTPEFANARQLIEATRPGVVVISTRLDLIPGLAMEAARAGCHLICEKPLALDTHTLHDLWDVVHEQRVQCYALLNNRALPVLAAARKAVAQGLIGEVKLLNARKSYKFGDRPVWFGDRARYGGTLPWIGIHTLDFIEAVTGKLPVRFSALHANSSHPDWPDCEDVAAMLLELEGGIPATVSIDYLRPASAPSHGDDWLRIVGDLGIIEAAMGRGHCALMTDQSPPQELELPPPAPYYEPLLRALPPAGQAAPDAVTCRSFALTQTALCARNAADSSTGLVPQIDTLKEYLAPSVYGK